MVLKLSIYWRGYGKQEWIWLWLLKNLEWFLKFLIVVKFSIIIPEFASPKIKKIKLIRELPCESFHFRLHYIFSPRLFFHPFINQIILLNDFFFKKSWILRLILTQTTRIFQQSSLFTWRFKIRTSNWLQLTLSIFFQLKSKYNSDVPFKITESFAKHLFSHFKGETSKMISKPSLIIEKFKGRETLKHLERLLHSKIFEMFWDVLEMVKVWVKLWILPRISCSRISRSIRSCLISVAFSVIGSPFLRIWKNSISFW